MKQLKYLPIIFVFAAFVGCGGGSGPSAPITSNQQLAPTIAPTAESNSIQLFDLTSYTPGSPITQPSPGVLGANELNLSYTAVGQIQYVLVFEPGFTKTFSFKVLSCTLSPAAVTLNEASATGPEAVLAIAAASAGACSVDITDGTTANTAQVAVVVTTTSGVITIAH
jgi:hypothetical protein